MGLYHNVVADSLLIFSKSSSKSCSGMQHKLVPNSQADMHVSKPKNESSPPVHDTSKNIVVLVAATWGGW